MNNADFWASIRTIIAEGFTPEGLHKLDYYAELLPKDCVEVPESLLKEQKD